MDLKLKRLIDKAEVVSFDIFDTLLLRPYAEPTDLFLHLEKIYKTYGFYQARSSAYNTFMSKHKDASDATFDELYSVLDEKFAFLKPIELEYEEKILIGNPEIKEVYEYALLQKKRVILASDMYLPMPFLVKILQQNGFLSYEKIYLSCELGKCKSNGEMYSYILDDLNIKADAILHIGDSKHSDIKMAKKCGLTTFYYQKVLKRFFKKNTRAALFYKNRKSLGSSIVVSLLALRDFCKTNSDHYWDKFGYLYGGVSAYAYAKWIEAKAKEKGISKILFVARDGYLPEKIFKLINSEIQSNYVYAPRIQNYISNLVYEKDIYQQAKTLVDFFYKKYTSVQELVDKEDFNDKNRYTKLIDRNMSLFQGLAQKEKESSGYGTYINSFIEGDESIVGVVDSVSSQLSGQALIQASIKRPTFGFYWILFRDSLGQRTLDHCSFFPNDEFTLQKFKLTNGYHFTELFFSAPEPSTLFFDNGKPVHAESIHPAEQVRLDNYKYIDNGAMSFAKDVFSTFGNQDIYVTQEDILELNYLYRARPTGEDIKAMQPIKVSDPLDIEASKPLFSTDAPFWEMKKYKRCLWKTPSQRGMMMLTTPLYLNSKGLRYLDIKIFPYMPYFYFKILLARSKKVEYSISIGEEK